ncbi:hypothetical protein ABK040_000909 [Willaertia magna]
MGQDLSTFPIDFQQSLDKVFHFPFKQRKFESNNNSIDEEELNEEIKEIEILILDLEKTSQFENFNEIKIDALILDKFGNFLVFLTNYFIKTKNLEKIENLIFKIYNLIFKFLQNSFLYQSLAINLEDNNNSLNRLIEPIFLFLDNLNILNIFIKILNILIKGNTKIENTVFVNVIQNVIFSKNGKGFELFYLILDKYSNDENLILEILEMLKIILENSNVDNSAFISIFGIQQNLLKITTNTNIEKNIKFCNHLLSFLFKNNSLIRNYLFHIFLILLKEEENLKNKNLILECFILNGNILNELKLLFSPNLENQDEKIIIFEFLKILSNFQIIFDYLKNLFSNYFLLKIFLNLNRNEILNFLNKNEKTIYYIWNENFKNNFLNFIEMEFLITKERFKNITNLEDWNLCLKIEMTNNNNLNNLEEDTNIDNIYINLVDDISIFSNEELSKLINECYLQLSLQNTLNLNFVKNILNFLLKCNVQLENHKIEILINLLNNISKNSLENNLQNNLQNNNFELELLIIELITNLSNNKYYLNKLIQLNILNEIIFKYLNLENLKNLTNLEKNKVINYLLYLIKEIILFKPNEIEKITNENFILFIKLLINYSNINTLQNNLENNVENSLQNSLDIELNIIYKIIYLINYILKFKHLLKNLNYLNNLYKYGLIDINLLILLNYSKMENLNLENLLFLFDFIFEYFPISILNNYLPNPLISILVNTENKELFLQKFLFENNLNTFLIWKEEHHIENQICVNNIYLEGLLNLEENELFTTIPNLELFCNELFLKLNEINNLNHLNILLKCKLKLYQFYILGKFKDFIKNENLFFNFKNFKILFEKMNQLVLQNSLQNNLQKNEIILNFIELLLYQLEPTDYSNLNRYLFIENNGLQFLIENILLPILEQNDLQNDLKNEKILINSLRVIDCLVNEEEVQFPKLEIYNLFIKNLLNLNFIFKNLEIGFRSIQIIKKLIKNNNLLKLEDTLQSEDEILISKIIELSFIFPNLENKLENSLQNSLQNNENLILFNNIILTSLDILINLLKLNKNIYHFINNNYLSKNIIYLLLNNSNIFSFYFKNTNDLILNLIKKKEFNHPFLIFKLNELNLENLKIEHLKINNNHNNIVAIPLKENSLQNGNTLQNNSLQNNFDELNLYIDLFIEQWDNTKITSLNEYLNNELHLNYTNLTKIIIHYLFNNLNFKTFKILNKIYLLNNNLTNLDKNLENLILLNDNDFIYNQLFNKLNEYLFNSENITENGNTNNDITKNGNVIENENIILNILFKMLQFNNLNTYNELMITSCCLYIYYNSINSNLELKNMITTIFNFLQNYFNLLQPIHFILLIKSLSIENLNLLNLIKLNLTHENNYLFLNNIFGKNYKMIHYIKEGQFNEFISIFRNANQSTPELIWNDINRSIFLNYFKNFNFENYENIKNIKIEEIKYTNIENEIIIDNLFILKLNENINYLKLINLEIFFKKCLNELQLNISKFEEEEINNLEIRKQIWKCIFNILQNFDLNLNEQFILELISRELIFINSKKGKEDLFLINLLCILNILIKKYILIFNQFLLQFNDFITILLNLGKIYNNLFKSILQIVNDILKIDFNIFESSEKLNLFYFLVYFSLNNLQSLQCLEIIFYLLKSDEEFKLLIINEYNYLLPYLENVDSLKNYLDEHKEEMLEKINEKLKQFEMKEYIVQ